ncbi:MAG: hypothetical protein JST04_16555 [Bdellovibrionales bacterium]|nr:hypothetical protein [Bdellovibrionales bacterium]
MSIVSLRTVIVGGVTYQVNRLYSSGVGVEYACTSKGADGKETTLLVSEATLDKDPSHTPLFVACAKRFDDSLTFAKYIGSSSFWQSQTPPDGIGAKK